MERKKIERYFIIGLLILLIGASINVQADVKEKNISNPINDIQSFPAGSIDRGLLGYWSLDDDSGPTATDDSGNGCDGTINGVPAWVPGKIKSGLGFDGSSNYINLDTNVSDLAFDSTNDYTVSMWVTIDSNKYCILYQISDATEQEPCFTIAIDTTGHVQASISNGEEYYLFASSEDTIPTGENWHHIVVIYKHGSPAIIEIYLDGNKDGFDTGTIPAFSSSDFSNAKFGRNANTMLNYFHGSMDEIRVYKRLLSIDDIQFLFSKPSGLKYTIIAGKFKDLNMNAGNFVTFKCVNVITAKFFPLKFNYFNDNQTIRVDPVYIAKIDIVNKRGYGLFLSNV